MLFAFCFHSLARKTTSCIPAKKHRPSLLWGALCSGISWQSDRGSSDRKDLAWDTPQTLCEVLLMPNYTSGLLEAKPNSLLGFVFLTLSSHEPRWLLNHHLPPVRADFLWLLRQRPKAASSRECLLHVEQGAQLVSHRGAIGFPTPHKPSERGAATGGIPHSITSPSLRCPVPFLFAGLVFFSVTLPEGVL